MALDSIYGGSPYAGPAYARTGTQLSYLPYVGTVARNLQLQQLLEQLQGPSYQSLYESAGADQLANEFRNQRLAQIQGLGSRGLFDSGAAGLSELGLRRGYQQGLQSNVASAQQSEQQRRNALLTALQQLGTQDVNTQHMLAQAALAQGGANNQESLLNLQRGLDLAKGSVSTLATLVGGIYGGVSGAGGYGAGTAGAVGSGASAGANLWAGGGFPTSMDSAQQGRVQKQTPQSSDSSNYYTQGMDRYSVPLNPLFNSQLYLSGRLGAGA